MFWIVLGMTLTVALAAFVVGIVALPARRARRPLLTPRGEKLFRVADAREPRGAATEAGGNEKVGKKVSKARMRRPGRS